MPNHVINRLAVEKNGEELFASISRMMSVKEQIDALHAGWKLIPSYLESRTREIREAGPHEVVIDFEKITPIPPEITAVGNPASHIVEAAAVRTCGSTWALPNAVGYQDERTFSDEEEAQLDLCIKCFNATGYTHWFDWKNVHWGTKWNAYEYGKAENGIYWQTAWSGVLSLMTTLSARFPQLELHYRWADEDIGYNVGECVIQGGEVKLVMHDERDDELANRLFAISMWGYEDEYDEDGNYIDQGIAGSRREMANDC